MFKENAYKREGDTDVNTVSMIMNHNHLLKQSVIVNPLMTEVPIIWKLVR